MKKSLLNTSWPSTAISDEGKDLIGKFFELVDLPTKDSGKRLAEEVFADDGLMIVATGTSIGSDAITKSRDHAWDVIATRCHEVVKVYGSDPEGLDLLLIGKLVVGLSNGKEADVSFAARIIMEEKTKGLRMKLYEVWSDQTPIKNLLEQV